jgi:DNA-binding NarL/FixJ family response regulator
VIADVNMPPGQGDDGLRAAIELRRQRPETGVLVLSQYYEERYALDLIGERAEGVGYLLKERVGDVESFIDAVTRVRGAAARSTPRSWGACWAGDRHINAHRQRHPGHERLYPSSQPTPRESGRENAVRQLAKLGVRLLRMPQRLGHELVRVRFGVR